jgi:hypothetical protein
MKSITIKLTGTEPELLDELFWDAINSEEWSDKANRQMRRILKAIESAKLVKE